MSQLLEYKRNIDTENVLPAIYGRLAPVAPAVKDKLAVPVQAPRNGNALICLWGE